MNELITSLLDVLGIVLLAAGATAGLWLLIGAPALAVGGVVVLAGSWLAGLPARKSGDGS